MENITNYVQGIMALIGICAAISAATPNKHDNIILDRILAILNLVGANIGNAKNK